MASHECPSTERLRSFSNGTLVEDESEDLFEHLEKCSRCLSELNELETHGENSDRVIEVLRSSTGSPFDSEGQCEMAVLKAQNVLGTSGHNDSAPPDSLLSAKIGDYEVMRLLGQGGMGTVYLATHQKMARKVALKVLARHRLLDPRMQERFAHEMRAIGALSHPNIVTAFDAREIDGTTVLVTEFIDGLDLGKVINRVGKLAPPDACQIAFVVAQVLAYTDQRGFVHRDIKPSNIMLSSEGVVKVLDLGLARLEAAGAPDAELTATGQALGSPDYAAPEQVVDSRAVDTRTDIYSLGCTLFKMLSGRNVFDGAQYSTPFAKMSAHVHVNSPSLKSVVPAIDSRLAQLVDSMLSKDPQQRPQSAMEVANALQPFIGRANLSALTQRALQLPDLVVQDSSNASNLPAELQPQTRPSGSGTVPTVMAIAAGLFGLMMGGFLGIVITITHPNGTQTKITVPDGSQVQLEVGDVIVTDKAASAPEAGEKGSEEVVAKSATKAAAGFLADTTKKPLPNMSNVKVFSSNKPAKLSVAHVDLPIVESGEAFIAGGRDATRVSPILLLDAKTNTVAISVSIPNNYSRSPEGSQIYVGQLPSGPFKELFSTEQAFTLLDHNVQTGQSLGVLGETGLNGDRELVLFEGLLTGNLQEVSRQRLPGKREHTISVGQSKLIAQDVAVVTINGVVYCWDLVEAKQLYQTDPNQVIQTKLSFSLDRTMMTLVDNSGVHFVETKTGADLGFVRFESQNPSIAPFDNNSQRIALCAEDAWSTYDLENRTLTKPQTCTWSLSSRILGWIGPDLFLTENGVVIHTDRQVPIWKFDSQSLAVTGRNMEFTLWADSISLVDTSRGVRIRTLPMPHKELKEAVASMPSSDKMMLTGPGTKARIELDLPDPLPNDIDPALLKSKMEEIMRSAQWELDNESPLKLVIKMAPGKPFITQHVTFEKTEGNQNYPGNLKPIQTPVEVTPMISTLELREDDKLIWYFDSRGMTQRRPDWAMPNVKQQTKEEFVESMQRPNSQFFYGVFLPTRIARPPYTHGQGVSKEVDCSWVPVR